MLVIIHGVQRTLSIYGIWVDVDAFYDSKKIDMCILDASAWFGEYSCDVM